MLTLQTKNLPLTFPNTFFATFQRGTLLKHLESLLMQAVQFQGTPFSAEPVIKLTQL